MRYIAGAVGAIFGGIIGGPAGAQWGWAIGSSIGAAIDPGTIKGPKIGEISQQTSQEGVPIPIVFGTSPPLAGNIIASSEPRIVRKKQSAGKKGPKVETESVYRTYAIGICEGPIAGVLRVWRNGILVYDVREGSTLDNDPFLEKARFFLGDYEQQPSPDLEAVYGVGTTPAHRGLAYLVMADEDLTDMRGAIPEYTFQVATSATLQCTEITEYSNEVLFPWGSYDLLDPRDSCNDFSYQFGEDGGKPIRTSLSAALADAVDGFGDPIGLVDEVLGFGPSRGGASYALYPFFAINGGAALSLDYEHLSLWFNEHTYTAKNTSVWNDLGTHICSYMQQAGSGSWEVGLRASKMASGSSSGHYTHGVVEYPFPTNQGSGNCPGNYSFRLYQDYPVVVRRVPRAPYSRCHDCGGDLEPAPIPGYCIDSTGKLIEDVAWIKDESRTYKVLAKYTTSGSGSSQVVSQYPRNPALPNDHPDYGNQTFWENAYNAAVAAGEVPAGWTYGVDYPKTQSYGYYRTYSECDLIGGQISLADLVTEICDRAGLTQIDVSQLDAVVRGFMVTNTYPASSALAALSEIFLFDPSSYDGALHFIPRGANSVATISESEMVEDDEDVEQQRRADAISIPRVLNLNYFDIAGGLNTDKQTSERPGDRRSQGDMSLQTSVLLSADEAAQVVAKNHKILIEDQRGELRFSLPDSWLKLVVADPIVVQWQGRSERCRITQIDTYDGYQTYTCRRDRQSAYVSNVEGIPAAPQTDPPSGDVGTTLLELLDMPLLRDGDDATGLSYYVAVSGQTEAWRGALLEVSYDGGANYTDSAAIYASAVMGELTAPLVAHPRYFPDEVHTVRVSIKTPFAELEETDLEGLLNRKNLALIGSEIIQFATAEETSDGEWELGYLLRGRRGTVIGSHLVGERFVLLDRGLLQFVPSSLADVGRALTFRATSLGATTDTGTVASMTYQGMSQTEFAPAYLQARRAGANLAISWQGVGRLGSGSRPAHSAHFAGYTVELIAAETTEIDTSEQAITPEDPGGEVIVKVRQKNQLMGVGPPIEVTIDE